MLRFMLEGPRSCPIVCFALIHYAMHELRHQHVSVEPIVGLTGRLMPTFLSVSSSVSSEQLLCFVHSLELRHGSHV